MESIATFHRVFSRTLPPLRADRSALGILPAAAHQYCEALRTASQYGWYVFAPEVIQLTWDGQSVYFARDGEWEELSRTHLRSEYPAEWNEKAPNDLKGLAPPLLTKSYVPGIVQIWSGLFVTTKPDWSVIISAPINLPPVADYSCFEGIVESDEFRPCPLFMNIRLQTTGRIITIPQDRPLFQVRPVRRDCYSNEALALNEISDFDDDGGHDFDWSGVRKTIRPDATESGRPPGQYGALRRKRRPVDEHAEQSS